jgi:hypothetical protein
MSINGEKNFIFSVIITFALICIPSITFAQWPITENPPLIQNDLDEYTDVNSNQTLPSSNTNSTYSNGLP